MIETAPRLSRLRSVSAKMMGLVGMVSMVTVLVAGIGISQMASIGRELTSIAEKDIPLTDTIAKVTAHQLEQAVLLERMLRFGNVPAHASHEELIKVEEEFVALAKQVEQEIKSSEHLAAEALTNASNAEERQKFNSVLNDLKQIEKDHLAYDKGAYEVIKQINAGALETASRLAESVAETEDQLDEELVALSREISVFTLKSAQTAEAHEKQGIQLLIIISVISLIVGAVISYIFARWKIARPLSQVATALDTLATGDTNVHVDIRSKDEIGQLADSFERFKENTIEMERLRAQAKEEEERIEIEKREATMRLADELESTVKSVSDRISVAVNELQEMADGMSTNATQTSDRANAVAAAAEEASINVQTVASASEELSTSIEEISRQVAAAMKVTTQTTKEVHTSRETVNGLAQSAQKIDDVVKLINDIADQTNLLALNATIEAARAGEAGKGFAVVASEVKQLAEQTGKATEDISRQVGQLQAGSEMTAEAILVVVKAIAEIDQQIGGISAAVEEQNAVTAEIARNASEVATGSTDISSHITDVSQAAKDSRATVDRVIGTIANLNKQSNTLQTELDRFLNTIRVA